MWVLLFNEKILLLIITQYISTAVKQIFNIGIFHGTFVVGTLTTLKLYVFEMPIDSRLTCITLMDTTDYIDEEF